eukprot:401858-Amphidinium_carterae.1
MALRSLQHWSLRRPASGGASTYMWTSSGTGVNMNATLKSPVRISCPLTSAQAINNLIASNRGVAA